MISDFKFLITCDYVGKEYAFACQKHVMDNATEFPNHEDAQMTQSEDIFGLNFLTGNELKFENDKEVIALCKSKGSLDIWLNAVSKKTYLFSGYSKVKYKSNYSL